MVLNNPLKDSQNTRQCSHRSIVFLLKKLVVYKMILYLQIDSVISSSLTVWFLSFSLSHSDCLIVCHKISPEWLYYLNSSFVQQFNMIETN